MLHLMCVIHRMNLRGSSVQHSAYQKLGLLHIGSTYVLRGRGGQKVNIQTFFSFSAVQFSSR